METSLTWAPSPFGDPNPIQTITYVDYFRKIQTLPPLRTVLKAYDAMEERMKRMGTENRRKAYRKVVRADRFFLLTRVLGRKDLEDEWHYVMCRMVEESPDFWLDFWFREAGKTSIITFGGIIQSILKNPKETHVIFSFSRPIAKDLMKPIKVALETNEILLFAFPDILTPDTTKYERWNEDKGLVVLGGGAGNTCTLEAHGLVEKQPTSKHFGVMVFNDMVSADTIRTANASQRAIAGWQLSQNLGRKGGVQWYEGTIYALNDPYNHLRKLNKFNIRLFPITYSGTVEGSGPFFSEEEIKDKYLTMGPYTFACQNLMKPQMAGVRQFNVSDFRYWSVESFSAMPKAILFDPAKGNRKDRRRSDYTAAICVGRGKDHNWYIIDIVRDKLTLVQRQELVFRWHRLYRPVIVGYEEYAMGSDIEHFQSVMERENYRFYIQPLGKGKSKTDRIEGLEPYFSAHALYFPPKLLKARWDGMVVDVVAEFRELEFEKWPSPEHEDVFDVLAYIQDIRLDPEGDEMEDDDDESGEWDPRGAVFSRRPIGRQRGW